MGGAVSSGRDNDELIDNLMGSNYIRSRCVERVFRVLDRAEYLTPEARDQAYKDLAWRNGPLHMSAPCIYSEVMEGLELKSGLSFLNVGSGTGYLSTLVGLILGCGGINHGVEVHPVVVEYANKKLSQFLENSPTLDEFDFCEPKFYCGNGLCLAPLQTPYDRVYCGAGCPEEYHNYFKQLIKVGGVLVMPLNDNLLQVRRVRADEWSTRSLLNVSFATLCVPGKDEVIEPLRLEEQCPSRLQVLARGAVRTAMRAGLCRRHPELKEPPPRAPPAKKQCPRRICIPIDDDSDTDGLNALHDLDRSSGANEMNALLSLVLSMGHNRAAGALRVDPLDSASDSSDGEEDDGDDDEDDDDDGDDSHRPDTDDVPVAERSSEPRSDPEPAELDSAEIGAPQDSSRDQPHRPDTPALPAEVEIYLGKSSDMPSTSSMDWEKDTKREHSSDEDTTESISKKEEKRQKFDSGIGEENTPSSSSSPKDKSDESDGDRTRRSSCTDEGCDDEVKGRRRRQKRRLGQYSPRSSSTEGEYDGDRRRKRRAADNDDARRVRLSIFMKRGVKELPLPYALKKYVNLGRCFEF